MKRVVVTGMGLVTPLGVGVDAVWKRLVDGRSGIKKVDTFRVDDMGCQIGGLVPVGAHEQGLFDVDHWVDKKERRRTEPFIIYALAAATEALEAAGWHPESEEDSVRSGVLIGSGIGGFQGIADSALVLHEKGPRRVSPFFIPSCLINEAAGHVSIRHKLRGPCHSVVTACATGAHAIGDASRLIQLGDADVMVAGGTEAALSRIALAGFGAMRALSTHYNDTPERASRPWDEDRDGFVMGDGAGVLVLEEREHALRRGAPIVAEFKGYGLSGDAYHISAPDPEAKGAYRAMKGAIDRAGIDPSEVDYVNAHATSTGLGDPVEIVAAKRLFGERRVPMSSTKSAIGHLLGAAGAVEAIFSILALKHQVVPPTLNLDNPSPECDLDLVPKVAREHRVRHALSSSFGFGGTNAAVLFGPA